jgi:hypothetical protein
MPYRFSRSVASLKRLRPVLPLAAVIALACTSGNKPDLSMDESATTQCVDPRPEVCTRDYRPVCGASAKGAIKTYGNACEACSDDTVVRHSAGEC